jgi:tetrahydromethanopterin S-methyltransferase subunit A
MNSDNPNPRLCHDSSWPPVRGDFVIGDPNAGVAVVTLASLLQARGPAIIGPCKTENLGIEKIVANVISNSSIRFIIICGVESKGHLPGDTLLALHKNGIDAQGRIVGSRGAIPFIQNLLPEAISRFQEQVDVIDCIGLENVEAIERKIEKYNCLAEPYPEEPFQFFKRKVLRREILAGEGDLSLGSRVSVDISAWFVLVEG